MSRSLDYPVYYIPSFYSTIPCSHSNYFSIFLSCPFFSLFPLRVYLHIYLSLYPSSIPIPLNHLPMLSNLISCPMYFVFIEIAETHYLRVELAVALNCRHQIHKHLVHINFPLSVIIHLTMTSSVYKIYQCNQLTIDEMHRLRQIV